MQNLLASLMHRYVDVPACNYRYRCIGRSTGINFLSPSFVRVVAAADGIEGQRGKGGRVAVRVIAIS